MFDLSDAVIEDLIFAMENQSSDFLVDERTGEVVDPEAEDAFEPDAEEERYLPIPQWESADGYRLMEDFYRAVGHPEAHLALKAALSRGRGVFRAFKDALEAFPEVERKWFEWKTQAMRRRIADWYDAIRVARGYERLGPEPEEDGDLIDSDFALKRVAAERWPAFSSQVRAAIGEAVAAFPEAVVEYEFTRMGRELESGAQDEILVIEAEAAAGAFAGVAAARRYYIADSSFAKLLFVYVDPDQRGLGIGKRLVERIRETFARDGIRHFIVDIPFLPEAYGASLSKLGYSAFGTRWSALTER